MLYNILLVFLNYIPQFKIVCIAFYHIFNLSVIFVIFSFDKGDEILEVLRTVNYDIEMLRQQEKQLSPPDGT